MANDMKKGSCSLLSGLVLAVIMVVMTAMVVYAAAETSKTLGKSFTSPDEAVKALIAALKQNDNNQLIVILGSEEKGLISSGDKIGDRENRMRFVHEFEESNRLEQKNPETTILHLGKDDWPMAIPIVKINDKWHFDTAAGKEEVLNRRIGRNELNVIKVMEAYVDAQHEYACTDRKCHGDAVFAQKFVSMEGKKDGLYWPTKEGETLSPFGPLVAQSVKEGYKNKSKVLSPYHGYYYKILKGQGENAPGGAFDYVVKGKMILGFGLVAYPADYGKSGVMTFIVNQQDVVYEKNLGPKTAKIASTMVKYDPDQTWKKVEKKFLSAST
jgi:hypothetical protein